MSIKYFCDMCGKELHEGKNDFGARMTEFSLSYEYEEKVVVGTSEHHGEIKLHLCHEHFTELVEKINESLKNVHKFIYY